MMTIEDCARAAFAAILRGDYAERDRLCALAENLIKARDRLNAGRELIEGEPILLPERKR